MSSSYSGKILHVDLERSTNWIEEIDERNYRRFLGGSALGVYILLRDLKAGIDPLGPDNILVITTSIINGLPLSGANRYNIATKSPLTGGYGEGQAGGYWGPELKRCGFDGLVIHGQSPDPVYIFVRNQVCEIRDAKKYWGLLSGEVQDGLEEEIGDNRIAILQTGVSGENRVRFAALVNQLRHFHGRSGLGAVMGSKNLKAIVVSGKESPKPADSISAKAIQKWFTDNYNREEDGLHINGTAGFVSIADQEGILPTRNFQNGSFDDAMAITGETISKAILRGRGTCYACTVACKREIEIPDRGVECKYGGMEYETIAAIGSLCGVGDLNAVAEASQWLNRYVLDSMSTGVVIAFAMECFENGIITQADTDGIRLNWGNSDGMIQMIHKIARREGIGNILAEGVKRAANQLGHGAEKYAMHVKGQELPLHEPRGKVGVGLQYAISSTGAEHMEAIHDPDMELFGLHPHKLRELGLLEPVDRMDLSAKKIHAFTVAQRVRGLDCSVGMCDFIAVPMGILKVSKMREYINAATGWDLSDFELMRVGERAKTLARLFNIREGFTTADDTLPRRMFEPLGNGKLKGHMIDQGEFEKAIKLYYQAMGWDEDGIPTAGKLAELGISDVVG
jgi:aldehyde:ferredoxin oxidoreductase